MAELSAGDVATYTGGRLPANAVAERLLKAALVAARNDTGWHVSPVKSETVTVDGPGGIRLQLPSKRIVSITSITENGVVLDPSAYVVSASIPGLVLRRRGAWTREPSGLVVALSHGFSEDDAADWREAILAIVDQMSTAPIEAETGRSVADLTKKQVDDVEYGWSDRRLTAIASRTAFSASTVLDRYRLDPVYFA